MKILNVTSEVEPFVKTGGLADVTGSLPGALHELGHDVRVVLPYYSAIDRERFPSERVVDELVLAFPDRPLTARVYESIDRRHSVPVYLIECDELYARSGIYNEWGHDYPDNALRFAGLSLAALYLVRALDWTPDILHCHDWHASLVPTYLRTLPHLRDDPALRGVRTLFTIHNLRHQGRYASDMLPRLGLPWEVFHPEGLEFHGDINLLKGALIHSDRITTVSPRYAQEIQTEEFGCGLEGVLRNRAADLFGIMNGIDDKLWNPETDPELPARYSSADMSGKEACREGLRARFGLDHDGSPLAGLVARMDPQKGLDLVLEGMPSIIGMGIQFVLLGSGAPEFERAFLDLAQRYPGRIGIQIGYNNALAHLIEAGADMFFMPSRFEPAGLNQLYSMRYGTLPVVRRTGGLADSVTDADEKSIAAGTATGFHFVEYKTEAFVAAVARAVHTFREERETWTGMMKAAMRRDSNWERAAKQYETIMSDMLDG